MKIPFYLIFIIAIFCSNTSQALDLRRISGNFKFTLTYSNGREGKIGDLEITYFKDLKLLGMPGAFEALKFENEFISIIKDSLGHSMILNKVLNTSDLGTISDCTAIESINSISGQPNSYTRMDITVTDENNFTLVITFKRDTVNIGPHIGLFPAWERKPFKTISFTRSQNSIKSPSSGAPEDLPRSPIPKYLPKFD